MTPVAATNDLAVLRRWVGRVETVGDLLDPQWARLMQQTLDRPATLQAGDALPPLWHWIYFLTSARISELGRDGHAAKGGLLPPVALPRRMWAGGRLRWNSPLVLGERATKTTTVTGVEMKAGRSGPLCFVRLQHDIAVDGSLRMTEEQDLVFREDPKPDDVPRAAPRPPGAAEWARTVVTSTVQLFRYSALTFNGHRIHYDRTYVTEVEGYPGLIVHGPLIATLLADLAVATAGGGLHSFSFRAEAPLFDTSPFDIKGRSIDQGAELWAETPDGALAMAAEATW